MINRMLMPVLLIILIGSVVQVKAQNEKVIDEIAALVGSHPVYWSDVEAQYEQAKAQGMTGDPFKLRCEIFENLIFQKLLVYQAETDSLVVSDDQVNSELDRRLRYYIQQFGSQKKLEEFYDKSLDEFKNELREPLKLELLSQQAQGKIVESVKMTPNETKEYFNGLKPDSIPIIPTEYEIGQIVKTPVVGATQLKEARDKLEALRARILKGEKFSTMAVLYSEDPGSAAKGGELGMFGRGSMAPEFESAAFNLKNKNDISEIIKTKFGYHLLQLIERKGDFVNVRHILIIPKVSPEDLAAAAVKLDSIADLVRTDSLTFTKAAFLYSDDPGRVNGGLIQSQSSGNTLLAADELDPKVFFIIDKMKPGEISGSVPYTTEDGTQAYRVLYLKLRTEPHRANLKDDYNKIQDWALENKKAKVTAKWIENKSKTAYIRLGDKFKTCDFKYKWTFTKK
ncbi:MAG: peptidylprolyl isomerase [Lentimicrobiaceae bacterium]